MELRLTVLGVDGGAKKEVGVHVPIHPLLDQQPRTRREALQPPAFGQAPGAAARSRGVRCRPRQASLRGTRRSTRRCFARRRRQ